MRFSILLTTTVTMFILSGKLEAAKTKPINGTILKVQQDNGKETGTITVKVNPKEKKGNTAPSPTKSEEKSFKITESTKLETVSGKKKETTSVPAKFNDLKEGNGVLILSNNMAADSIKITKAKKTKKTKAAV